MDPSAGKPEPLPEGWQEIDLRPPTPPPPRRSAAPKIALACGGGCFLTVLLVVVLFFTAWPSFVRFGITSDLSEIHDKVRDSGLAPEPKEGFLRRLEALRERARGSKMGFLEWLDYDTSIRSIVDDGVITEAEAASLDRELRNLEGALR